MTIQEIVDIATYIQETNDPVVFFAKSFILGLILFLFVRYLLIGGLFKKLKGMDKEVNKYVRKQFASFSWVGWIFFLIGMFIFEFLALKKAPFLTSLMSFETWIFVVCVCFLSGIFFHLYFLTRAIIHIFQQRIEIEKN